MVNDNGAPAPATHKFSRDALTMVIGVGLSQGLALLVLPILTRLYGPQAIALQALFLAVGGSLTVLGTLRLDLAIVLQGPHDHSLRLFVMIFYQSIALGGVISVAALLGAERIRIGLSPSVASVTWIWLIVPFVVASCLQQAGNGLATRYGRFKLIAVSNFSLSVLFAVTAITIGLVRHSPTGLVWARVLAQVAVVGIILGLGRFQVLRVLKNPHRKQFSRLLIANRQFLLFNTPYSLIGGFARDIPLYVLTGFGNATLGAAYALARTITLAPTTLISAGLSSVFFRAAAQQFGTPKLEALARRLTVMGLLVTAALFSYLASWGNTIFALVLGSNWEFAGQLAQALAIPLWLALQNGWPERLFEVAGRQRVSFLLQLSFDILHAAVVITVYLMTRDALLTVRCYALSYTIYQVSYRVAVYKVAGFELSHFWRTLATGVGIFFFSMDFYEAIRHLIATQAIGLVVSGCLALGMAAAIWRITSKMATDSKIVSVPQMLA